MPFGFGFFFLEGGGVIYNLNFESFNKITGTKGIPKEGVWTAITSTAPLENCASLE